VAIVVKELADWSKLLMGYTSALTEYAKQSTRLGLKNMGVPL